MIGDFAWGGFWFDFFGVKIKLKKVVISPN
jgi:hypothetical protein